MLDLSYDVVLWVKAFHIISVIAWMAGLLYLPRLFVYHCEAENGSEFSEKLKIMELRLFALIMRPARIFTIIFGSILLLGLDAHQWRDIWWIIKFSCVILLYFTHDLMNKWRKSFYLDLNSHSQRFYRVFNEVPTVLMIIIVMVVVIKPM
jgi:protoporphyrinogen IX oxidase